VGLSITKRLVELHHGSLTAESRGSGLGSCFTISLPILTNPPSETSTVDAFIEDRGRCDSPSVASAWKVKLIALTGWGGQQDREFATRAGFDLHLVKLVAFRLLLGDVQNIHSMDRQTEACPTN
jgi:hypothetical protein